ncbi:MAG TPA: tetratricopeptide repeat protein [Phycisphaerae bacterium]|jgi:predicted Zn-dependent protease
MSYPRRIAAVRVKLLLVLIVLTGLSGAGLLTGHYVRKNIVAQRALSEGRLAVARQDWPEASKQLKRYLSKRPDDDEILEQYAHAQLAVRPATAENFGAAIGALRRLFRHRPDDLATARQLIKLYTRTGQYEQAAFVYERLGDTDDPQATLWWARAMLAQRKFEPAAARLERLVEKRPEQIEAYLLLSDINARGGSDSDPTAAQRWLDRAVEADAHSAQARVKRAAFLRTVRNDSAAARADLEAAEQILAGENARRQVATATLRDAGGTGRQDAGAMAAAPAVLHDLASEWLAIGETERAAALITNLERFDANALTDADFDPAAFALARFSLSARLAIARDAAQASADVADRALAELQGQARSLFLPTSVELYVKASRAADARKCLDNYREFVRTTGTQAAALTEQLDGLDALVLLAEGHARDAAEKLERLTARNPQNAQLWRLLAQAQESAGAPQRGVRAWEEYATRAPGDSAAALRLARAYAGRDWSKTLKYARIAENAGASEPPTLLGGVPSGPAPANGDRAAAVRSEARRLRIEATLESNDKPNAAQLVQLAAELNALRQAEPRSARLRILAARVTARKDGPNAAIAELEQAPADVDDPAAIALQVVRLHAGSGHPEEGIAAAAAAIAHQPQSAVLRIALSERQQAAGQAEAARGTLAQAVSELTGDERMRAQGALAQLLLQQGKRLESVDVLKRMVEENPSDLRAPLVLLSLPEIESDAAEAARLVDTLKRIEGEAGPNWKVEQASLWLRGNEWRPRAAQIVEMLSDCLKADPAWTPGVLTLGTLHERLGEFDKAERLYRQAFEANTNDLRVTNQLLALLERQRRFAEAEELLQRLPTTLPTLAGHRLGVALGRGDYDAALDALQSRVAVNPRDAEAYVLLARLTFGRHRDVASAFKHLDQAAAIAPDLPSILPARVAILHGAGRRDEVLALLDEQVQTRNDFVSLVLRADYHALLEHTDQAEQDYLRLTKLPDSASEGYAALGRFYERIGRGDDAQKAWQTGLDLAPEHDGLQRLLAQHWIASKDAGERASAGALIEKLAGRSPDDPQVQALRAALLLTQNTPEANAQAETLLERVVAFLPQNAPGHVALVRLARQRGDRKTASQRIATGLWANPRNVPLTLESAKLEADSGNAAAAQRLARSVVEMDDKNLDAYRLLVALALQSGDVTAAHSANDAALKLDPLDPLMRLAQGEILAREGRRGEALAKLEEFRQSAGDPPRLELLLMLAELYRQEGDFAHGGQCLDAAEKLAPQRADVLIARLKSLAGQKRYDEILALTADAPGKPSPETGVLLNAASLLALTGEEKHLRAADGLFERLTRLAPKRVEGHIGRAQVAYRLGNLDAAEAAYQRVLEIDPNHQQTLNDLAWVIGHDRGKPQRGLEFANRAVLRYPDDPHLLDTRGVLLAALGRHEEAQRDLEKCVKLSTDLPETRAAALLHLGRVFLDGGNRELAKPPLEEAARIDRERQVLAPEDRAELTRLLQTL